MKKKLHGAMTDTNIFTGAFASRINFSQEMIIEVNRNNSKLRNPVLFNKELNCRKLCDFNSFIKNLGRNEMAIIVQLYLCQRMDSITRLFPSIYKKKTMNP